MYNELQTIIGQAWENRELLAEASVQEAIREVIRLVDRGELRTAEPTDPEQSRWQVNEWVKKAVILYFPIQPMRRMEAGELEWYDKMDLKHGYEELGVRAVPHAVARYGAYIAPGAILMPSYVNIGAYVDTGTMVDTWATVGSCAQIGRHVHLSGGVGIGGVLEPVQAARHHRGQLLHRFARDRGRGGARLPRGGARLEHGHHRFDAHHRRHGGQPVEYRGYVPPRSVVIPGSYAKKFPAGEYSVACALIIGRARSRPTRRPRSTTRCAISALRCKGACSPPTSLRTNG
ncbi:2,3,4,5-tetrahydropyridine-2-carboxylate N-succinyltransferase [human gut metagenome]|uniref:2,3,4,5-tetrahydropyridine-2-carboxylate N-succinyltransferase n=1 Tax=human gut metagenome TaxID=408170 RepID=K1UDT6_9ZZZZ